MNAVVSSVHLNRLVKSLHIQCNTWRMIKYRRYINTNAVHVYNIGNTT